MNNETSSARAERLVRQSSLFSQLTAVEARRARRVAYEAALAVIG